MDIFLTLVILAAPFTAAALLSWWSHRRHVAAIHPRGLPDDPDWSRVAHDADAVRTRFEHHPSWPTPGARGERR